MTGFYVFAAGFVFGAAPGIVLIVRNMLRARSLHKRVEKIAFEERKFSDPVFGLSASISNQRAFLVCPERLFSADDSQRLRSAKEELLAARPQIVRRHQWAGGAMLGGAAGGALLGYLLAVHLGLPLEA